MKTKYYLLMAGLILTIGCKPHNNESGRAQLKDVCRGPKHITKEQFIADGVYAGAAGDEWYWNRRDNNLTCAEMHQIHDEGDLKGSWAVYIVGTGENIVTSEYKSAVEWTESRPFVQNQKQVR